MLKQSLLMVISTLILALGTSAANWTLVDEKINSFIDFGYFPGCVLGVFTNNATLYKKAYGTLTPKWSAYSPPMTVNTKFDINYLTQVIGINSAIMMGIDELHFDLSTRVARYVTEFDNNGKRYLTVKNMLLHNSGLPFTYTGDFGSAPADLLKKINQLSLEYKEETKFQYSELGYVALGEFLQKVFKTSLKDALFQPLLLSGLRDTQFLPKDSYLIAPSGFIKESTQGKSGNKIANFLNSMAGHAGLFSTVDNLGTYLQLLLNKGKMPSTARIFSENITQIFTTKVTGLKYKNNTRALGWDTVPDTNPPCGKKFSQNSFGLADPTFSYIWTDKDKNISIVFLANGKYPAGTDDHGAQQGELSDVIMGILGY